jgi:hypothetical protein
MHCHQIARIFEDQLAEAILADDGQIAFSNLAASAVSSVMPKMETQGQLGKARFGTPVSTPKKKANPTKIILSHYINLLKYMCFCVCVCVCVCVCPLIISSIGFGTTNANFFLEK